MYSMRYSGAVGVHSPGYGTPVTALLRIPSVTDVFLRALDLRYAHWGGHDGGGVEDSRRPSAVGV